MQDEAKALEKDPKDDSSEEENDANARIYELGYLLVPTIEEKDVPAMYGNLKEFIYSFQGEIISDEIPRMTSLAYPMLKVTANKREKFNTAYFAWIKFAMDSQKILELKKKLDLDPNLLRFLILKTVRENTIATKRFVGRDMVRRKTPVKKDAGDEVATPINKEEIDKEIDAMVAM